MAGRKRIIVLDDDASVLASIERLLRLSGYETEVFSDVPSFVAAASLDGASCMVLDIDLGEYSGIDLKLKLASAGIEVPAIFITAMDDKATEGFALEAGCVAYLHKPFASRDLIAAIEQAS